MCYLGIEPWGFPVVTLGSTKLPVMVYKTCDITNSYIKRFDIPSRYQTSSFFGLMAKFAPLVQPSGQNFRPSSFYLFGPPDSALRTPLKSPAMNIVVNMNIQQDSHESFSVMNKAQAQIFFVIFFSSILKWSNSNLCDYFVSIHGHHKNRHIHNASFTNC